MSAQDKKNKSIASSKLREQLKIERVKREEKPLLPDKLVEKAF